MSDGYKRDGHQDDLGKFCILIIGPALKVMQLYLPGRLWGIEKITVAFKFRGNQDVVEAVPGAAV